MGSNIIRIYLAKRTLHQQNLYSIHIWLLEQTCYSSTYDQPN